MGNIKDLLEKERKKFIEKDKKKKAELQALSDKVNHIICEPDFCRDLVATLVNAPRGEVFNSLIKEGEHPFTFQHLCVKAMDVKNSISKNSLLLDIFELLCEKDDFVGTENIYHERKYANTKYKGEFYKKGREGYNHQKIYLSPMYLKKVVEPYFIEEGMRIALGSSYLPDIHYEFVSDIILKIKLIEG